MEKFHWAGASSLFTILAGDILHSVRVIRLLACSAKLLVVNLVSALYTPHIGTFPADIAVLAVIVAVLLL